MTRISLPYCIAFCALPLVFLSQNKQQNHTSVGITKGFETHVSYTQKGISKGIGFHFQKAQHQLGLGIVAAPSNYKTIGTQRLGFYTDYKYYTHRSKSVQPFINAYYSNTSLKQASGNTESIPVNTLQNQFFAGYGISVKVGHFRITNSITYGSYIEVKKELYSNRRSATMQMSHQFKMTVAYDF